MDTRSVAIRHDPDEPTIIGSAPPSEDLYDDVVKDRLNLPWSDKYKHIEEGDRQHAVRARIVLTGLGEPEDVYGATYQIIDLPDEVSLADWAAQWPSGGATLRVLGAFKGQFRAEIYPNEGKHRGQPHCKVTYARSLSGSFTLPEGKPLPPRRLGPHEAEASKFVRENAGRLQRTWDMYRPDDQRLPSTSA